MWFHRFIQDRRASVAPLFAASIIPAFGLIGAGVDYTRASAAATAIQSAADSTALALSKDAPSLSADQLQAKATSYFAALLTKSSVENVAVTIAYTKNGGSQLVVSGSGSVKTMFMGMWPFNIPSVAVKAVSTSTWGNKRLRVALVLDNTGSMANNGKMTALKTASHNLLAQLKKAATQPEDVYVSIVPFSKDVNAGSNNHAASWIDWTEWDDRNGVCSKSSYSSSKFNCVSHSGTWTPDPHNTWNGCVMDRDQNSDTMNTSPNQGVLFPAEQYGSCPAALMPLSNDWTALDAKIDAMTPVGYTNQTIGLVWGWQALTTGTPLNAPALDPNYQYQQVIILLTDGLNTQNRWTTSQSSIDSRMQKACTNAKADGITLYTVLVMEGNAALLQGCASDSDKYFKLTSADQIITTFETIGTNLSKLRLAK